MPISSPSWASVGGRLTPRFDQIDYWSEIKLDIVREYASAYSRILTSRGNPSLYHVYIDGFAGAGEAIRKATGEFVPGSPLNALRIQPPFREFFLIDLDRGKSDHLREMVKGRSDVHILQRDCNEVLIQEVFPKVRYENYRRALCLLDPYGLHLEWRVIEAAGKSRAIDLFLNFPIMDANRNALWRNPEAVSPEQAARLTAFWGDDSWRSILYRPTPQRSLFGEQALEKVGNPEVAEAFRARLQEYAGFAHVPRPIAMRNRSGAVVYYLYFASQKDVANDIVTDIFKKYETRGA